jgi:uncharacterized protein YecE (DUF72 family)
MYSHYNISMLYIGCPIWSFKGWVGNFYPKGIKPADFLREYAKRLTNIEGNTTFTPSPPKARWKAGLRRRLTPSVSAPRSRRRSATRED